LIAGTFFGSATPPPRLAAAVARKRCTKRSYATRGDAQAAISSMVRRFGNVLFKKPYRCGKCKAWHITSRPWKGGRRIQH